MEKLLHYVWRHKMWRQSDIKTSDGLDVEVIDVGLQNHNSGPDFFNAKIRIGGVLWVGNIEIHDRSSDWYHHSHDTDDHYNNVILHVVGLVDKEVRTKDGRLLPQLQLSVPQEVKDNYQNLLSVDRYPPCYKIIPELSPLTVHSWMSALQTERLEQKTIAVRQRVDECDGSWEAAYFVTLARNYGFGINGDAFEAWAKSIPLHNVDHHRDDLFQIEALFMGQAGFFSGRESRVESREDEYYLRLREEYRYLSHKFQMTPIDVNLWRFLRLRPQNFPYIRLSQLAVLYYNRHASLSAVLECETVKQVEEIMTTHVSPYWETHYSFGSVSDTKEKNLSKASIRLLIINTVVPVLFAYGRYVGNEKLCDRAFDFLEELQAEDNHITRMWQECGMPIRTAGDSQALIQLKKEYCDRKDCLRCRIGWEYLKPHP
ncbi:MAG: DUF2851 family protein [Prevotella sp.]|nr:DUF2851 family protein [Prevotella sp.]